MTLEDFTDIGLTEFIEQHAKYVLDKLKFEHPQFNDVHNIMLASQILQRRITEQEKV